MSTSEIERGKVGYNKYPGFENISYECFEYLMDNNEMIWRLAKYTTPTAWQESVEEPNLTKAEKGALIWAGEGITSDFSFFMDEGPPDVATEEVCQVRIFPFGISPDNRTVGTVTLMMEVYSNYKTNTMSNYQTRNDRIIAELIRTFNGAIIEGTGIGRLHFNKKGTSATRMESAGQIPFKGKWLLFGNKV